MLIDVGDQVVRMRDRVEGQRQQLVLAIPEDVAERAVDLQEAALG